MNFPTMHFAPAPTEQLVGVEPGSLSDKSDAARRTNPDTMEARLLELLRREWVTPLSALEKVQCLSLSQRCGSFARRGYAIEKRPVTLANGKNVMSYRIAS